MKIIKATRGDKYVYALVALNNDEPEWVHVVGEQERDATGRGMRDALGTPVLITSRNAPPNHTGDTEVAKEPGRTLCYNCRYNWKVQEFMWRGHEMLKPGPGAEPMRVPKEDADYLAEIKAKLVPPAAPVTMSNLLGQRF